MIVQETVETISEPSMMISENSRTCKIAKGKEKEYLPVKRGGEEPGKFTDSLAAVLAAAKIPDMFV